MVLIIQQHMVVKKSIKGGNATYMNSRFFNPNAQLDNSPELLGNKTMSAYGTVESGDIGTGMLAPYGPNSIGSMKTGGNKMTNGPIPNISDEPLVGVQSTINSAISGFSNFMTKLDEDYAKSLEYIKSIKIGNQQLIQGGAKSNKKPSKKSIKKGGDGSDFASTTNSRGPVNAPDDYWGVPGEQWFKQFNKTGEYIPNSKLAVAATPLLAGTNDSKIVSGYDGMNDDYGSV